ncbi:hypothetical protein [Tissierella sp.]|uniref:hypothetical protein n=1 Tax=Tissierella sp. TaxID=41274 RepID=UPI003067A8C3
MKVEILESFSDKESKAIQIKGEIVEMTEERVEYIISKNPNLIKPVEEKEESDLEFPKHIGGGYYELSNGEKVKGKDEAIKAEDELNRNE